MNQHIIKKMEEVASNFDDLVAMMKAEVSGLSELIPPVDADPIEGKDVIVIADGDPIPWLVEAQRWEGKSEVFDQEELTEYLGVNPNDKDGGVSWCAYFVNAVMRECGIEGTGSGAAASFENWGTECGVVDGAIAVYGPGAIPGGHVGFVVGNGLFGGNQGDSARLNRNRAWFDQNKTLIGYRCPPGYTFSEITV